MAQFPFTQRPEFGGDGTIQLVVLDGGQAWAMLGPESGPTSIDLEFDGSFETLIAQDPLEGDATIVYLLTNCGADVSGDDAIDLVDLNLVLANFGQTTPNGDTNSDGVVDLADLNTVLAGFGTTCD